MKLRSLVIVFCCFIYSVNGLSIKKGYKLHNHSLLYGFSEIYKGKVMNSVEYQWDSDRYHPIFSTRYRGLAASISWGNNKEFYGLKGMFKPYFIPNILLTRRIRFVPYFMLQLNVARINGSFSNYENNVSPGIGLNGFWRITRGTNIRVQFQVRYNLNEQFLKNKDGLRFDLRVGYGLSSIKFWKRKYEN